MSVYDVQVRVLFWAPKKRGSEERDRESKERKIKPKRNGERRQRASSTVRS